MRPQASILHLDLDAFYAAVEQRDKPSLRGKPVIVGGIGQRGVVATASYEARAFGVGSAMPMHEARRLCPHAAFLAGRFGAYKVASGIVMGLLRERSSVVEPLSLDEAYVDLEAGIVDDFSPGSLVAVAEKLRAEVVERTGGLTASVGLGSSKFIAKLASERAKPNGVHVVTPGTEVDEIADLPARAIPGVGPATMERLSRLGVRTVADVRALGETELVRELGRAAGEGLYRLSRADDDRPVHAEREAKSISVEDTFERDLTSHAEIAPHLERDAALVARRLAKERLFARTIIMKLKMADFSGITRSQTLLGATDRAEVITRIALRLLEGVEVSGGVRLAGVGVSGFTESAQEELFDIESDAPVIEEARELARPRLGRRFAPGADVVHAEFGPGWVWGSGLGRVTVRFETATTPPGPVRTFREDDPALTSL